MRTIHVVLSDAGLRDLRRDLEAFEQRIRRKTDEAAERIASRLEELVQDGFSGGYVDVNQYGSIPASAGVTMFKEGNSYVVSASGAEAVFIEFGAGVTYNTGVGGSLNPLGPALGFTIGSYGPRGAQKAWLYYQDGKARWTEGTPAQMPMYNAIQRVIEEAPQIVREVFASD